MYYLGNYQTGFPSYGLISDSSRWFQNTAYFFYIAEISIQSTFHNLLIGGIIIGFVWMSQKIPIDFNALADKGCLFGSSSMTILSFNYYYMLLTQKEWIPICSLRDHIYKNGVCLQPKYCQFQCYKLFRFLHNEEQSLILDLVAADVWYRQIRMHHQGRSSIYA